MSSDLNDDMMNLLASGVWSSVHLKALGEKHGLTFDQIKDRFEAFRDGELTEPPKPQPSPEPEPGPEPEPAETQATVEPPGVVRLEATPEALLRRALGHTQHLADHPDVLVAGAAETASESLTALIAALSGAQARAARREELTQTIAALQAELDALGGPVCDECGRTFANDVGLRTHKGRTHRKAS